jgi:hypothetical protein
MGLSGSILWFHHGPNPMVAQAQPWIADRAHDMDRENGLLLGLILVIAIAFRAVREERVLEAELPGYDAYIARVKYRLIPYVW